jgi:hypothetical protein
MLLGAVRVVEPNQSFHPLAVRCCFRCWVQGLDDAPRGDVLGTSEHDMEHLAVLIVAGLRVRVAIDGLQRHPGILELYLYVFLLMRVQFLFALPLVRRRAVLALLLHLVAELFRELFDLPAL